MLLNSLAFGVWWSQYKTVHISGQTGAGYTWENWQLMVISRCWEQPRASLCPFLSIGIEIIVTFSCRTPSPLQPLLSSRNIRRSSHPQWDQKLSSSQALQCRILWTGSPWQHSAADSAHGFRGHQDQHFWERTPQSKQCQDLQNLHIRWPEVAGVQICMEQSCPAKSQVLRVAIAARSPSVPVKPDQEAHSPSSLGL